MNVEFQWNLPELSLRVIRDNMNTGAPNVEECHTQTALTQQLNTNTSTKMEYNFELWDNKRVFDEMFRATGKSTRLVDELIQEFFKQPAGTKIPVCDHYPERQADEFLLDRFMKRLESEHPSITCKVHRGEHIMIERTTKTYHEQVREEYAKRQEGKHKKI